MLKTFSSVWEGYFDLDRDYAGIREALCRQHKILRESGCFCSRHPHFTSGSVGGALFIYPFAKQPYSPYLRDYPAACGQFGPPGEDGPGFPSPQRLAGLSLEDLAPLRSGFRAKYLLSAARLVTEGAVDLQALQTLPLPQARLCLQQIAGVGPKVAECVLLYGLHRLEAFPLDVWDETGHAGMVPAGKPEDFGPYAGIAQQYLFHYSRHHPKIFTANASDAGAGGAK